MQFICLQGPVRFLHSTHSIILGYNYHLCYEKHYRHVTQFITLRRSFLLYIMLERSKLSSKYDTWHLYIGVHVSLSETLRGSPCANKLWNIPHFFSHTQHGMTLVKCRRCLTVYLQVFLHLLKTSYLYLTLPKFIRIEWSATLKISSIVCSLI